MPKESYYIYRAQMVNATTNPSPLDAIVHKFLTIEMGGDYVAARERLPFARRNGILCSSFVIAQDAQEGPSAVLTQNLRTRNVIESQVLPNTTDSTVEREPIPREEWTPAQVKMYGGTDKVPYRTKETTQVAWGNSEKGGVQLLNEYPTMLTPYLFYVGITTDFDYLQKVVKQVFNLGKNRTKGYGQIKSAELHATGSCDGIVDSLGRPLRAIPVDSGIQVAPDSVIADATYQPAYWDPENRTKCYVPEISRQWSISQIEKEFA